MATHKLKPEVHTIIEFGCWYCRLSSWLRHKCNRCDAWCAYCYAEAVESGCGKSEE